MLKEKLYNADGQGIRIVVIDSGINLSHPIIQNMNISDKSIAIHIDSNEIILSKNINDEFGHGTAVCGILAKLVPKAELIILKIFDEESLYSDENKLIFALKYILKNVQCDIIHMSLGITTPSTELKKMCKKLYANGIVMISSYDNAGAISYPANYAEVIGVDVDDRCIRPDDFMLIESNNTIVLAKGGNHRLAWINPQYIISRGSSFSAAYVTAYVAKMLSIGVGKDGILSAFQDISLKSIKIEKQNMPNLYEIPFEIKNAVIFPYNKEMHSLVNYADYLPFNIKMICDSKYTGRINKKVGSFNGKNKFTINSIDNICWEDIDTLILGHLKELESTIGQSIKKEILEICTSKQVNVYAFDDSEVSTLLNDFIQRGLSIYTPKINNISYLKQYMGKMFQYSKPVVGVFGTSSQQGKFTLQLSLRYNLLSMGYTVAQIGTEPTSLLFGLDACYPFGYNSTIHLNETESILAINYLVHVIDEKRKDADIIIVGSQSGTVPTLYNNISQMTTQQLAFLMGIMPDIVILCVNADDEIDVILRNIKAIEGVGKTTVIAIAIYPLSYTNSWEQMNNKRSRIENIEEITQKLKICIQKPVFVIGDNSDTNNLCNLIINSLSEDN